MAFSALALALAGALLELRRWPEAQAMARASLWQFQRAPADTRKYEADSQALLRAISLAEHRAKQRLSTP